MQGLRHAESHSEVEVRQEARFVLWALRCCVLVRDGDNERLSGQIDRGFELADASETVSAFREFGTSLYQAASAAVIWHGPECGCISSGEMHVLHALAQVADHRREQVVEPSQWWRVVVPAARVAQIDQLARQWLAQLHRAGIEYPGTTRLIEALTPLQSLVDEWPRPALN